MAEFFDKVKSFIKKDPSKVGQAIDKAADFVDKKTEGKYSAAVDKVQDVAKKAADKAVEGE
ncbi:MAG: antitoxin [Segniliparus sp.]|uniref:antitoxin n=1 Tax=Segniliparus sp. TaxID=2804064 RepID=UPI003F32F0DA